MSDLNSKHSPLSQRLKLKTYSHLLQKKRMPTEYELVTSNLHYYIKKGFEVNVPIKAWYERYQKESGITLDDWEKFSDPRETTYTKYTDLQKTKEIFVNGILQSIEDRNYDKELSSNWIRVLSQVLPPIRYPLHGFQMIASYIGQMGPSGKITIVGALQSADEMRRIQRIAYRIRQLQKIDPNFGLDSKAVWEKSPHWQPLRKVVEKLLVTYDWTEAWVGLNLCLKPVIDELFMKAFSKLGTANGDYLLGEIFQSLNEDCRWHRQWSGTLVNTLINHNVKNRQVIQEWINRWLPLTFEAALAFEPLFDQGFDDIVLHLNREIDNYHKSLEVFSGLSPVRNKSL